MSRPGFPGGYRGDGIDDNDGYAMIAMTPARWQLLYEHSDDKSFSAWWKAGEMYEVRFSPAYSPFLAWTFFNDGLTVDDAVVLMKGVQYKLVEQWHGEWEAGVTFEQASHKVRKP